MTYEKPNVSVIGDASRLIEGGRNGDLELPAGDQQQIVDCELDD